MTKLAISVTCSVKIGKLESMKKMLGLLKVCLTEICYWINVHNYILIHSIFFY